MYVLHGPLSYMYTFKNSNGSLIEKLSYLIIYQATDYNKPSLSKGVWASSCSDEDQDCQKLGSFADGHSARSPPPCSTLCRARSWTSDLVSLSLHLFAVWRDALAWRKYTNTHIIYARIYFVANQSPMWLIKINKIIIVNSHIWPKLAKNSVCG